MPKEKKKRGRREEAKRKREEEDAADDAEPVKRPRVEDEGYNGYADFAAEGPGHEEQEVYPSYAQDERQEIQFYGLLDEQEQAYFRQADSALELDQFADPEEKNLFLNNLWKEAKGKELKIANSQSCSRLMERLIAASNPIHLKALWMKFSTHFLNLSQHRFASHCCEALFRKTANIVTMEMSASAGDIVTEGPDGEELTSMENMFLSCVEELEANVGYLITDQFASHPLRVLLVVLSGMPLEDTGTKSLLQSRTKEHNVSSQDVTQETRVVPESFQTAIETIISGSTTHLDTSSLRALATHPVANPVLQLLLTISLTRSSKQTALKDPQSLFRLLIPDDPPTEDTESAAFINHLLYDPVGSRLLEVIVTHAPGKTFKSLFRSLFKEKLPTLARNETASFVVTKIISRLSTADLESVLPSLCTEIPALIHRSRTIVLRTLITRCQIRSIDTNPIATALQTTYGNPPDLRQMLKLPSTTTAPSTMSSDRQKLLQETTSKDPTLLNNSLLLQSLLTTPGPLRTLATTALLASDTPTHLEIACDRTSSRVLQAALTPPPSSSPPTTVEEVKFLRLLLPRLLPHIIDLATHPVASHVVDALWPATSPPTLQFLREQVATELLAGEAKLRATVSGRAVWRNWDMDSFKYRRRDWMGATSDKASSDGAQRKAGGIREKTGIELARERHALKRAKDLRGSKGVGGKAPWANAEARAVGQAVR